MKKFIINENDSGQRADKFIMKVSEIPKSLMYKFIRTKKIKLNRKKFEISYKLQTGDVLEFYIDEAFFKDKSSNAPDFLNASTDINIVYEDNNIILINKPDGVIVHSDRNNTGNTLADSIKNYLYKKGEFNPYTEASFAPAVCNRLDRNTCGIVIAVKNASSLREMNECIRNRKVHKKYLCLTVNTPSEKSGIIKAWHFKDENFNKVFISDDKKDGYKEIITKQRVEDKFLQAVEQLRKEGDILFVVMVHVDCFMAGIIMLVIAFQHLHHTTSHREAVFAKGDHIHSRKALAARLPCTLTLIRGGRAAPQEIFRKTAHNKPPYSALRSDNVP